MASTSATVPAPLDLGIDVQTDSAPSTPFVHVPDNKGQVVSVATIDALKEDVPQAKATASNHVGLVRFRVPKKSECFIAPAPETYEEAMAMIKRECPSLANWPTDELTMHITFDPALANVEGVMFRVLPQCWPDALTNSLKFVAVRKVPNGPEHKVTVKPLSELSERERMAFSELPDVEGLKLDRQEAAGDEWEQAAQQQVVLGDGPQAGSVPADAAARASEWQDAVEQQVTLGDGQQRSGSTAIPAQSDVDRMARNWEDAVQQQVTLGDGQEAVGATVVPAQARDDADPMARNWGDATEKGVLLGDH